MGRNSSNIKKKTFEDMIKLIKNLTDKGNDIYIQIKNKKTNECGVALLMKDGRIGVFEGADDGSDDKIYKISEFKEKYEIIKIENEFEEEFE